MFEVDQLTDKSSPARVEVPVTAVTVEVVVVRLVLTAREKVPLVVKGPGLFV